MENSGNGQAGALEEIEITSEMLGAGVAALEHLRGAFGDAHLFEAVYTAMASCAAGCDIRGSLPQEKNIKARS